MALLFRIPFFVIEWGSSGEVAKGCGCEFSLFTFSWRWWNFIWFLERGARVGVVGLAAWGIMDFSAFMSWMWCSFCSVFVQLIQWVRFWNSLDQAIAQNFASAIVYYHFLLVPQSSTIIDLFTVPIQDYPLLGQVQLSHYHCHSFVNRSTSSQHSHALFSDEHASTTFASSLLAMRELLRLIIALLIYKRYYSIHCVYFLPVLLWI